MRFFVVFVFSLAIACASTVAQDVVTIRGIVRAISSQEALRFVTVSVPVTRTRVLTDRKGAFTLRIPRTTIDSLRLSTLQLVLSCIGYRRDTIYLPCTDTILSLQLQEQALTGAEIVVSAEDPAVPIMRRVLQRRQQQLERLSTYTYTLYTKFVAKTDTATAMRSSGSGDTTVNSILESFSRGYVKLPDQYHNEIFQKRQTANVPPEANFVSFGTNLNIYDENVTILGEEILSPFASDALDAYDYRLVSSQDDDTVKIEVRPMSALRRSFIGTIYIDQRLNVPLEVDVRPNDAVNLPFSAQLAYRQNFMMIDSMIVPEALSISSTLEANILFVIAPRLDIDIETFCYDYVINPELPDGIFDRRRVETASNAADFDSTYWQTNLRLPLTPQEQRAYQDIQMILENPDSLQNSMFEQILGPVSRFLQRLARRPFTGFEDIFRFNTIHGAYLGIGVRDRPDTALLVTASLGYGFADQRFYGQGSSTLFLDHAQRWSIDVSGGRILQRRDDPTIVRTSLITATSLLFGGDYGDYYLTSGYTVGGSYSWGQLQFVRNDFWTRPNQLRFAFANTHDETVQQATRWSLFRASGTQRTNPEIADGMMRSLRGELFLSYSPLRRVARTGMAASIEAADSKLLGGDFDFVRATWLGTIRLRPLPLWTLDVTSNVVWGWGAIPPQRFVSSESGIGALVVGSAFRGMGIKEFYGDRLVALQFSQNFGEVAPGLLRIPNVASLGIEFLLFGGVLWTSFSEQTMAAYQPQLPQTDQTPDRTYVELGVGVNRLLLFFRVDVNARFSQRDIPQLRFTITNATF